LRPIKSREKERSCICRTNNLLNWSLDFADINQTDQRERNVLKAKASKAPELILD